MKATVILGQSRFHSISLIKKEPQEGSNEGTAEIQGLAVAQTQANTSGFWIPTPYLDPEEPTFLGFPIMISLYKSLKR